VRVLACVTAALALTACFPPNLGDGAVACGENDACPPRYYCHTDKRCWRAPEAAADMSAPFDFAGADFANCSRQICQPGQCGVIADGCGGTLDCGQACPMGTSCGGGGIAQQCGCATEQYCNGRDCGTMPDGCGGVVACGTSCPSGQVCGAGGTANVCGAGSCQKRMCRANKDCGLMSDGCAAVLDCGGCQTG
jgi:hypothetical protein